MSSEQPVKKKLRRAEEPEGVDEQDYIHNLAENGMSALHLSISHVNEADIALNNINIHLNGVLAENGKQCCRTINEEENNSIPPAPNIYLNVPSNGANNDWDYKDLEIIQNALVKQCLCGVSDSLLRNPFENQHSVDLNGIKTTSLLEWPTNKLLQLLSNLQLLFDVYLKQNNKGYICSQIVEVCNRLVRNELNIIEQLLSLIDRRNKYLIYLLTRIISSFLIITKTNLNNEWLEIIVSYLCLDYVDYDKMNFGLEVIKRVVEWKDVEIHVLEEPHSSRDGASISQQIEIDVPTLSCTTVQYSDSESFDTSSIKGLIIRSLETKWSYLIGKIQDLIETNNSIDSLTCILAFFSLWESTISVKANLSIIDTKPFYTHLESFASLLLNNTFLPAIIWKQLLSLFNEILCYGSTLALQDMLPDDICKLAYVIVRYVKDARLLEKLPYR